MNGKRITAWLVSIVAAIVVTYIVFEYTPVAIPFFEGGIFTVISVILAAFALSVPIDAVMKAGVYDETGVHFGMIDAVGPIAPEDPSPTSDKNYKPIVNRTEREKMAQKLLNK